jgi:soluble lytic murein transglycosylase-like protein
MGLAPRRASAIPAAAERPAGFGVFAREAAERHGVPEKLVLAVIQAESGGNRWAVSPKGARGLMQLMPQTASLLGVRDSFDPAENIDGGVRHLRRLIDRYGNDLRLALAAYNAGENAVGQYRGVPPFAETQGYVRKVLALFGAGDGDAPVTSAEPLPVIQATYKSERDDGTVMYSNIPPAAALRARR